MKKLITLTSILAAGTLCASAAVNLGSALISSTTLDTSVALGGSGADTTQNTRRSNIFSSVIGTELSGSNLGIYSSNSFVLTDGTVYATSGKGSTGNNIGNFVGLSSGSIVLGNQ